MNGGHGGEIRELLAHFNRLPFGTQHSANRAQVRELQRSLDGRNSLLQTTIRERDRIAESRRWVESDINGFNRALILVGGTGRGDEIPDGGVRLQKRLETQMSRASELTAELAEIDRRIEHIESDILSHHKQTVELLRRCVDDAEQKARAAEQALQRRLERERATMNLLRENTMWSPTAVMGYRVWLIKEDGLFGAWYRWGTPRMEAECRVGGDLPHTDGRCAKIAFGCGVYAAKSPEMLMRSVGGSRCQRFAVGLVGLEGRVIEHEKGYRAERATVLALAVANKETLRMIDDAANLETVFGSPKDGLFLGAIQSPSPSDTASLRTTIADYLENQARRKETWTSANPNA